ncbi:MAG: Lsr2 family protein [Phycicoccus sp.]|nr:Lsr2 family protein [Phycicoccus sp.]
MAKRTLITIVDDLDQESTADETVSFALDGLSYSIDLTAGNAQKLRDDLAVWVSHATQTGGRKARKATKAGGKRSATDIREWGRANGFAVNERGRVSRELQDAYDKAH